MLGNEDIEITIENEEEEDEEMENAFEVQNILQNDHEARKNEAPSLLTHQIPLLFRFISTLIPILWDSKGPTTT